MLRLPPFTYLQPKTLKQALVMKTDAGPAGMYGAGGTDLYPNMKRRHQTPATVISLGKLRALARLGTRPSASDGLVIGPGVTLTGLAENRSVRRLYPAIARAAELISTPILRNMGTVGGNLCLDTRSNYYRSEERRVGKECRSRW